MIDNDTLTTMAEEQVERERSPFERAAIWLLRRWWALAVIVFGGIVSNQFGNLATDAVQQIFQGKTPTLDGLNQAWNNSLFRQDPVRGVIFLIIAGLITAVAFVADRAEQARINRKVGQRREAMKRAEREQVKQDVAKDTRQIIEDFFRQNRAVQHEESGEDDEAGGSDNGKSATILLPQRPSLVVGREVELARITTALEAPGVSAIALKGMGGVGKSTLLAEVLHRLAEQQRYPDGIIWVACNDLIEDEGEARLYDTIGLALGKGEVTQVSGCTAKGAVLSRTLAGRRLLLALDNVEAQLPLDSVIHTLTTRGANGAGSVVLLTTRTNWPNISSLQEIDLSALSLVAGYDLLKQLVAQAGYTLSTEDETPARQIVEHVGALPLALRLVAPRIARRTEPLTRLAERLRDEGVQLKDRTRGIERSFNLTYDQLDESQQEAFNALGAFTGTEFSQEAALAAIEALTGSSPSPQILSDLVDYSFLVLLPQSEGTPRYQLHPLLQQFAREKLRGMGPGSEAAAAGALARFYQALTHQHTRGRRYEGNPLEQEYVNIIGAATWAHAHVNDAGAAGHDAAVIVSDIVADAQTFIVDRGYWSDGRRLFQWGADASVQIGNTRRASTLLSRLGFIARTQGDFAAAEVAYRRALDFSRAGNDKRGEAARIHSLGTLALNRGDYAAARAYYDEALAMRRRTRDEGGMSSTLRSLGILATANGQWDEARAYFSEALSFKNNYGASRARTLAELAAVNIQDPQGDRENARQYLQEALAVAKRMHLLYDQAHALDLLGALDLAENDVPAARQHWEEALALYTRLGTRMEQPTRERLRQLAAVPTAV